MTGEWRRLKDGAIGAVAGDGTVLVRVKLRAGLLRSEGKVEVSTTVGARDTTAAALLAVYAALREGEERAAAVSAPATLGV
jgi:hypothetical protein